MIWIPNQLIGAREGQQITLECVSEAYPKSINYWTRDEGEIVPQGKSNIFDRGVCGGDCSVLLLYSKVQMYPEFRKCLSLQYFFN